MTTRNRLVDNQKEAGDFWKDRWQHGKMATGAGRWQPARHGLAPQAAAPVKRNPKLAMNRLNRQYPQGNLREGGTTSAVCLCGKICKNARGLKIHQSRMKCLEKQQAPQCTRLVPGESEEEQGLEAPHRAQSLQVVLSLKPCSPRREESGSLKHVKQLSGRYLMRMWIRCWMQQLKVMRRGGCKL